MKRSNKKGFSLAELLIVVAILGILAGLSFVAVSVYARNLKLTEMDGIAQEIFISSQNQLSKAKANGTYDTFLKNPDNRGKPYPADSEQVYYVFANGGHSDYSDAWEKVLLPFGSIDETVRNKHIVIRYNYKTAKIEQVYYTDDKDYDFSENDLDVPNFPKGIEKKEDRKNYNGTRTIIGLCNGVNKNVNFDVKTVNKPSLTVVNEDKLTAAISVTKDDADLNVILCVQSVLNPFVRKTFTYVFKEDNTKLTILDDITVRDNHFYNLFSEEGFLPGEDIEIYVTVQAKDALSNFEESDHIITNSLFGSIKPTTGAGDNYTATAQISNFRHLENLCKVISGVNTINTKTNEKKPADYTGGTPVTLLEINAAEQTEDLISDNNKDWATFIGTNEVVDLSGSKKSGSGKYYPVDITLADGETAALVSYSGNNMKIEGVDISVSDSSPSIDAGLFGTVSVPSFTVNDLELLNFNVSSTKGNSGALVGTASGKLNVTNVIAYNCKPDPTDPTKTTTKEVGDEALSIMSKGTAGGLIGSVNDGTVNRCAASVYVKGETVAGGLIGSITSGSVTNSYSGGHTDTGAYKDVQNAGEAGRVNVISEGQAGGLIGMGTPTTLHCYSSSSVYGKTKAHPFCGSLEMTYMEEKGTDSIYYICREPDGSSVPNWYAIGWVFTDEQKNNVKYPWFRNEDLSDEGGLLNLSGSSRTTGEEFNYDEYWSQDIYPSLTISEMNPDYKASTDPEIWFMEHHVGDWAYPDYTANFINTN